MEKMETRICALSAFGECNKEFEVTSKSPHQRCCCPKHGTKLRWLRRKARIREAFEVAARAKKPETNILGR